MPAGPPTVFTLEAVNALVPRLRILMHGQMAERAQIEQRLERLAKIVGSVPQTIQPEPSDPPAVRELKGDLAAHVERYQAGWRELEEMGAVLKDPRIGLLDFYGSVEGKMVWLCWKYGESECCWYHALEEGFSARKPIADSIRHRLLN